MSVRKYSICSLDGGRLPPWFRPSQVSDSHSIFVFTLSRSCDGLAPNYRASHTSPGAETPGARLLTATNALELPRHPLPRREGALGRLPGSGQPIKVLTTVSCSPGRNCRIRLFFRVGCTRFV